MCGNGACVFESTKLDNSAEHPEDLWRHTRAHKNAVLLQLQTFIKNGRRYVSDGFGHPAPIIIVKRMQASLCYTFRCSCFIRRSLEAGAFLVLPRVHSQVYVGG